MKTDREHGALRVLEALSAVDEELLERSGRTAEEGMTEYDTSVRKISGKSRRRGRGYRFVGRYAGVCAACLLLAVTGAAYYGVSRSGMKFSGSRMPDGSPRDMPPGVSGGAEAAAGKQEAMEYAPPAEMPYSADSPAEGGQVPAGGADGRLADNLSAGQAEPAWLDIRSLMPLAEEDAGAPESAGREDAQAELHQSAAFLAASEEKRLWESFAERAKVPEGYGAAWAKNAAQSPAEEEAAGSLLLEWSDGEYSLWLKLTQTKLTADMRFDAQPPVYTVQEKWRELIPDPDAGADGYAQFGLLYEDGLLAEYRGALSREETIELLESLAR